MIGPAVAEAEQAEATDRADLEARTAASSAATALATDRPDPLHPDPTHGIGMQRIFTKADYRPRVRRVPFHAARGMAVRRTGESRRVYSACGRGHGVRVPCDG
jgi:hypothetical protein